MLAIDRPKRVAVVARKGGVGKTTTTVQLAIALSIIYGINTLVVDNDPQGNATARLGVGEGQAPYTLNDVYSWTTAVGQTAGLSAAIHPTTWPGVFVVAGEEAVKFRETEGEELADYRLQIAYERSDFTSHSIGAILMDTQPGTGGLLRNAMIGADAVLVVSDSEPDGLLGAHKALEAAESIKARQNPGLQILGVLVNHYDSTMGEHERCVADLIAAHGERIWLPVVPRRAAVATARGIARPVQEIRTNGGRAYVRAMNEHARRLGRALELQES